MNLIIYHLNENKLVCNKIYFKISFWYQLYENERIEKIEAITYQNGYPIDNKN